MRSNASWKSGVAGPNASRKQIAAITTQNPVIGRRRRLQAASTIPISAALRRPCLPELDGVPDRLSHEGRIAAGTVLFKEPDRLLAVTEMQRNVGRPALKPARVLVGSKEIEAPRVPVRRRQSELQVLPGSVLIPKKSLLPGSLPPTPSRQTRRGTSLEQTAHRFDHVNSRWQAVRSRDQSLAPEQQDGQLMIVAGFYRELKAQLVVTNGVRPT